MKEIRKNMNKMGEKSHVDGLKKISIIKTFLLLKIIYRFNAILIKTRMTFFTELGSALVKSVIESQKTLSSRKYLEQKEQSKRHYMT